MSAEKDAFDAYHEQVLKALSDSRSSGEGLKSQLTQLQKVMHGVSQELLLD